MRSTVKNPSDRLSPLGLMLLALLGEDDMHPYEMIRLLRHRRDERLVKITNGTVYHTVARLERDGLLAEVGVDRDGNRPERTTYTLTDAGAAAVVEWVRGALGRIDRPAEYRVALAEAHNLDRAEVLELLTRRATALRASRDRHREGREGALRHDVSPQFLLEVEREETLQGAEAAWLDGLIERIADPDFTWGADAVAPTDRYIAQREAARR